MGGLSLPQPNCNGKEGPSLNSLDTLKWAPQGDDHGPSLDISRSYRETLLYGAWLKISGHILTGKLMKSCRTHAGVPVPALVAGEAASVPRPWPDKPRSIHSLLVLMVPMAAAGMGSWGMDPVNDGGDPLSLWG